ncbi:MAG: hypothetical protein V4819_18925 [Verrucomicrobiota bacterium]
MNARLSLLTLSVLGAAASPAHAGEPAAAPISVASAPSRWRFGAGYAPLIGLKTEFNGLGNFNSPFSGKPTGGGVNYNYDDGFVHVDSSGNLGGETWNWGYDGQDANGMDQYSPANGGSIDFSITNSVSNGRTSEDTSADLGVELFAYYDMGAVAIPGLKERGATWGFRGGLHYARVNVDSNGSVAADLTTLTDRFTLDGVIPPPGPYAGTKFGPGPLLNDSPSRTITTGGPALVAGSRHLDVHLTTFNFGSYLEVPVTRKFGVMFEAGVSAAISSGEYAFNSSTTATGLGTQTGSGSDSDTTVLPGFYLGLGGTYQLNHAWSIQAAGRYQYMDEFDLGANGSNASLSFDSAFVLSIGALYSF